ncbi:hypothetical protein M3Y94_00803900 [Aphelenchoides besseyi]|nr:hypothetical protein M3Y94_00803900 [Aphelenchoides besseyi]KAI6232565.1 LysM and putative peptidoglycan-binding domain-containing protein 1 [Aphelenchoides besseyi]
MSESDECTFLCGYQRFRRYGSTCDLNSPTYGGFRKHSQVIQHEVQPTDTLQSLELKYNSSMFEIKRLNRLWSNDALHCKTHVNIPLFEETRSAAATPTIASSSTMPTAGLSSRNGSSAQKVGNLKSLTETKPIESMDAFFKRIDGNVKQTKKAVRKLNKNRP